jgi:acylphosphatase
MVNVRAEVLSRALESGVGGFVMRTSTSTVLVRAASPEKEQLGSFLAGLEQRYGYKFKATRKVSTELAHIDLAISSFFSLKTAADIRTAGRGRLSDDPDDARSYSTRGSPRGF